MVFLAYFTDDDGIAGLSDKGLAHSQYSRSGPRPSTNLPLVVSKRFLQNLPSQKERIGQLR